MQKRLSKKHILLLLDYDGTLTPIVETPGKALLPKRTKDLLYLLSRKNDCTVAIISGRALKNLKDLVSLKNIIYSGNHGFELEGPQIKFKRTISAEYRAIIKQIKAALTKKLSSILGVVIEDKGFSLSLHYRLVNTKTIPIVKKIFKESVNSFISQDKIRISSGKMVLEVGPPDEWDKGKVALWILSKLKGIHGKKPVIPIYVGDDLTDEDAFKALSHKGLTVFVGYPKHSYARYYLKNPEEVTSFLQQIRAL